MEDFLDLWVVAKKGRLFIFGDENFFCSFTIIVFVSQYMLARLEKKKIKKVIWRVNYHNVKVYSPCMIDKIQIGENI